MYSSSFTITSKSCYHCSFLFFLYLLVSFRSMSTIPPAHKSSLPLSALLPSLTLCHIALSHSLLFPPHLSPWTHSLYLSPPSPLYLPPSPSILRLHSCFRPHWDRDPVPARSLHCYPSSSIGPFITLPRRYWFIHQPASSPTAAENNQRKGPGMCRLTVWILMLRGTWNCAGRILWKFPQRQESFEGDYYKVFST